MKFLDLARDLERDLSGRRIWLGRSRRKESAIALAAALEASVRTLGAEIDGDTVGGRSLPCGAELETLRRADAIVMVADTPGVCAEALDFAAGRPPLEHRAVSRMDVLMPSRHTGGYMHRRLEDHGAMVSVYEEAEAADGTLAVTSLNNILTIVDGTKREEEARRNPPPTIGIVTALQHEYDAVRKVLPDPQPDSRNDSLGVRTYLRASLPADGGGFHGVVVGRSRVGNNAAAAGAQQLLHDHPTVRTLLMVGIAAGIPDLKDAGKDILRGDVVVCDEFGVVQYDMKKVTADGDQDAQRPRAPSQDWLTIAENIASRDADGTPTWWATMDAVDGDQWARPATDTLLDQDDPDDRTAAARPLDTSRPAGRPRIHFGPIGSANIVMKKASERDEVKRRFGVVAVEMEGSGVAEVAWRATIGYLVVRGICDYANADKDKLWQRYAALAAAAFTRSLVEAMPLKKDD